MYVCNIKFPLSSETDGIFLLKSIEQSLIHVGTRQANDDTKLKSRVSVLSLSHAFLKCCIQNAFAII